MLGSGKPRVGDRVQVTFEGEVDQSWPDGFSIRDRNAGYNIAYASDSVKNVEIVARRREVGDHLDRDEIKNWPRKSGTLIMHRDPGSLKLLFMKLVTGEHWSDTTGVIYKPETLPAGDYEIVYLPEWAT